MLGYLGLPVYSLPRVKPTPCLLMQSLQESFLGYGSFEISEELLFPKQPDLFFPPPILMEADSCLWNQWVITSLWHICLSAVVGASDYNIGEKGFDICETGTCERNIRLHACFSVCVFTTNSLL